jgi:hypothetical protein
VNQCGKVKRAYWSRVRPQRTCGSTEVVISLDKDKKERIKSASHREVHSNDLSLRIYRV